MIRRLFCAAVPLSLGLAYPAEAAENKIAACWQSPPQGDASRCATVTRDTVKDALVFLEVVGIKADPATGNETRKGPWNATGFIVDDDGYVITNNHLFISGYDKFEITAHVGDRYAPAEAIIKIPADDHYDFAVLKLLQRRSRNPVTIRDPYLIPDGSRVVVVGFPSTLNLHPSDGTIDKNGTPGLWWATNASLDPGSSGSPVFDQLGNVIAVAEGQMPETAAINYLIPISFAFSVMAPLHPKIYEKKPAKEDGFESLSLSITAEIERSPTVTTIDIPFSDRQSIHSFGATTNRLKRTFAVPADFAVTTANFTTASCNYCGQVSANVQDGTTVSLSYSLTSGPIFDQTNGWISGTMHVTGTAAAVTSKLAVAPQLRLTSRAAVTLPLSQAGTVKSVEVREADGKLIGIVPPGQPLQIRPNLSVMLTQQGGSLILSPIS